jgi:heterodisulfide reductase subunit B
LEWRGKAAVRHLLSVLAEDIGLESIKARIVRPYHRLAVAAHYGCHALRPGRITQFDNPLAPTVFERLIAVTGAVPVVWSRRLECCGAPLWEKNEAVSLTLMRRKLADARRAGASCLCTACTYCQIQFETVQADHPDPSAPSLFLPSLVYTHLLGPALGISPEMLGMQYDPSEPRTVLRTQSG